MNTEKSQINKADKFLFIFGMIILIVLSIAFGIGNVLVGLVVFCAIGVPLEAVSNKLSHKSKSDSV